MQANAAPMTQGNGDMGNVRTWTAICPTFIEYGVAFLSPPTVYEQNIYQQSAPQDHDEELEAKTMAAKVVHLRLHTFPL